MNRFTKQAVWLGAAALGAGAVFMPQAAAAGFGAGVRLCVGSVLPALFPCFVACRLLTDSLTPAQSRRLLLPLSWLGGYAVCAGLTGRLYRSGVLTRRQAAWYLCVGCCSAPGFAVGCVGGLLLGSVPLGVVLYLTQLVANLAAAWVCRPLLPAAEPAPKPAKAGNPAAPDLPGAVTAAVDSCLQVSGCVVFFGTVLGLVQAALPLSALGRAVVGAVLEISTGCAAFAAQGGAAAVYGCCLCLSVLGLSVWAQLAALTGSGISLRPLVCSRAVHLAVYPLFVYAVLRFWPGAVPALAGRSGRVVPMLRMPPDALATGALFLLAVLYKVRKTLYNIWYNYGIKR